MSHDRRYRYYNQEFYPISQRKGAGILTPFLLGVPIAAALIFAERTFQLLRENFALGTVCWVVLAIITMWVTLSVAAIVDRKPGDWVLWLLVIIATSLAATWASGYNAMSLFTSILTVLMHK